VILKSIEEEASDCRAACAHLKVGDWAWLVHHGILAEPLTEPIENRISYILEYKTDNVALRLRLLRPLVGDETDAEFNKAIGEYYKTSAEFDKINTEFDKAINELYNAYAEPDKARGEYYKARDEYIKAYAEYYKASTELYKYATMHYHRLFPDSPWNGKTVFAGEYAL
jgi:tetratricopeptide (TPR) repeat protein